MTDPERLRILILEDDPADAELLERELRRAGELAVCRRAETEREFLAGLSPPPDLVLAEYRVPGFGALAALRLLAARDLDVPVIVVTGTVGDDALADCLREGATDYLRKDHLCRLGKAVRNAVAQCRLRLAQRRQQQLDGRAYAVCGISTDVADRRRLEARLRQAQKMEAVGQLAGCLAHDFNNLLTVILGYGNLLVSEVAAQPALLAHVEQLRQAGERGAALTRQLLAFSRQQAPQPSAADLNAVVADFETMLRRLIGEDVELATVLRSRGSLVLADRGQVEQVILNLALNARDAMPGGGSWSSRPPTSSSTRPTPSAIPRSVPGCTSCSR